MPASILRSTLKNPRGGGGKKTWNYLDSSIVCLAPRRLCVYSRYVLEKAGKTASRVSSVVLLSFLFIKSSFSKFEGYCYSPPSLRLHCSSIMTKTSKYSSSAKKVSPTKVKPSVVKKPSSSKSADQVILEAMAKLLNRGTKVVEKKKLLSVTRLNDKTMANAITKLKQKGFLDGRGSFELTDDGRKEVSDMDIEGGSTNKEVHESIKSTLKGKAIRLFELLENGDEHCKEEIAQALDFKDKGKKQKGFQNLVASVKSEGIVCYPTKDTIQLVKEQCFPYDD